MVAIMLKNLDQNLLIFGVALALCDHAIQYIQIRINDRGKCNLLPGVVARKSRKPGGECLGRARQPACRETVAGRGG
jgi:hypothetical protein